MAMSLLTPSSVPAGAPSSARAASGRRVPSRAMVPAVAFAASGMPRPISLSAMAPSVALRSPSAPLRSAAARGSLASRRRATASAGARASADPEVVIVGGGIAGLCCARALHEANVPFLLLEAAPEVGGRVRTDVVDGFKLDHGFQIFLSSYPEAKRVLDYDKLDLQQFYAGALVRTADGEFHRVADPFRHPVDGVVSLANPIGSLLDKVLVGAVRFASLAGSLDDLYARDETTIEERLRKTGFSEGMIDQFFRPFLGGIFFDRNLGTTSRLFDFVMRMLATGSNCLPVGGIGAVSEQVAAGLPPGSVRTGARVASVEGGKVTLEGGEVVGAPRGVVVAVEGPEAKRLLGEKLEGAAASKPADGVGTACVYFKTATPPAAGAENVLFLDGVGKGLVNNMCFPSAVSASYAPAGQSLVSVSTLGTCPDLNDQDLAGAVKSELSAWFPGEGVEGWELLKVYRIPYAQPNQAPPTNLKRAVDLGGGMYVCGDHRDAATLEGAMVSGRRAAEAILAK